MKEQKMNKMKAEIKKVRFKINCLCRQQLTNNS
jgi:hypothetical protein